MRPPEFTGGNGRWYLAVGFRLFPASMRPPEFTGGNLPRRTGACPLARRFNEAAGIHRRKPFEDLGQLGEGLKLQ